MIRTSDGYWTILETVPYSLQNNTTNAAGTISNIANATQLTTHQHQSIQQSDRGNSNETNLIASATVVVEIPSESMGNDIKYTIPESEHHQLIHATRDGSIATGGPKQRIHIVKDVRLNSTVALSQQTTIPTTTNVEQSNRQHTTQAQLQQQFTINNCLGSGVVVQHHRPQRQQTTQPQREFIKIEAIPEKIMLRNVIQYDSVAVNSSSGDVITTTDTVINAMVENDKRQQQHLRLQNQQQQQQEVLNTSQSLELLDKATIEAVNESVLNAFNNQQEHEQNEAPKQQSEEEHEKLSSIMNYPTKILMSSTTEPGLQLQYVCNLCGKSYKIKGSLKRHKRYECGVAPTVACHFCPHKCKYKSDLRKHVSQKHAGQNSEELLISH
ncbi:longitudinals lacking protein, isoforms N/O/W/X/Y-like [Eurosta solidaginis]|uniref:longitudinals lacking protein, isoforms N/O/W/X/Y-like n=1 Tax=Eurosta solidaginis TaxID=178769 RepID=UPI0035314D2F